MRFLPLLALAALAAGCSSGGAEDKKTPSNGAGEPISPAAVDLEAECRAASRKWSNLKAVYRVEGADPVSVVLAVERGGRMALRVEPGPSLVLDGAWVTYHRDRTARVPIGALIASVRAAAEGRELPPRGEHPPVPEGLARVHLALGVDPDGRAARSIGIHFSLRPREPFVWLEFLRPADGLTIRAVQRAAVVTGAFGRVEIDRDTGSLLEWTLEPPGGRTARLRRESVEVEAAVDEAVFRSPEAGSDAPTARALLLPWTLELAQEAVLSAPQEQRMSLFLAIIRAYVRLSRTDEEMEALAARGRARRKEVLAELKTQHKDVPEDELASAATRAGEKEVLNALGGDLGQEFEVFWKTSGLQPGEGTRKFQREMDRIYGEELLKPVFAKFAE